VSWVHTGMVFRGTASFEQLSRAGELLGAGHPTLSHAFQPFGLSYGSLDEEVRVAIHTWPEHGLLTVDVYARRSVDIRSSLSTLPWKPLD